MTAPILIVEDEAAIRRLVRGALERAGMTCDEAANAAEGLALARRPGCELVLLDLGLPDRDGMELVPLLVGLDRAVVVVTARDAVEEMVAALDLGADDYVTKPFDSAELLARIRVALRHRAGGGAGNGERRFGHIGFDAVARRVTRYGKDGQEKKEHGEEVHLTPKEFAVFAHLARNPGRVVTHGQLLRDIWGEAHVKDVEYLRVTMRGLRAKLEEDPARPSLLRNDPGIGYRLVAPSEAGK